MTSSSSVSSSSASSSSSPNFVLLVSRLFFQMTFFLPLSPIPLLVLLLPCSSPPPSLPSCPFTHHHFFTLTFSLSTPWSHVLVTVQPHPPPPPPPTSLQPTTPPN